MIEGSDDVQRMLERVGTDEHDPEALLAVLYVELRSAAQRLMGGERASHTLQPTALVHEAFLRLVDSEKVGEMGRLQFLATGTVVMRRILIDHARSRETEKRGGAWKRVTLQGLSEGAEQEVELDLVQLDDALAKLEALDPRQAKIVELRFFSGMSGQEIADHLGLSRNTVVRELALSRAWLHRELTRRE